MTTEVIEGNKAIAEFMGFIYYQPLVHFDIDGVATMADIFSKVPIDVKNYDGANYFEDLPNPDFGNPDSKQWNPSFRWLNWQTLNHGKYIYDLEYNTSWDWLMPCVKKVSDLIDSGNLYGLDIDFFKSMQDWILSVNIENAWSDLVEIIQWYNQNKQS